MIVTAIVFYNMLKIFLIPVFLAAVFAGLIYPLYEWLLAHTKHNRGLSAFLSCLALVLIILIPTYLVIDLLRHEVVQFYQQNEQTVQKIIKGIDPTILKSITQNEWLKKFGIEFQNIDLQSTLLKTLNGLKGLLLFLINKTGAGTFQFIMNIFIMFFTMYYFFKDGDRLLNHIKYLSPLNDEHEEMLFSRFVSMSRATVKGTLLIGLTQGGAGGLLLWIFGFGSPIVAAVVMFFLSIVPMVGAWLVLYPVGVYYIISGNLWQGVAIILITAFVIGNLDNFLRPKLVGRDTGMHDLFIFFSTIGGMSVFGVMGFIVGPVIAALFLTTLEIYRIEFKDLLDQASKPALVHPETELETPAASPEA
ncbi:MAG: AI-2E family transporter [Calditrichaeota bacterium]|nr:MAG: AI-2E family transporter [Calditrichota bacterium]